MKRQQIIDNLNFFKNVICSSSISENHPINRVIERKDFRKFLCISRATEWRMIARGSTPELVRDEGKILGYNLRSYLKWLEDNSES